MYNKEIIYKYSKYKSLYNSLDNSQYLLSLLAEKRNRFSHNNLINGDHLNQLDIGLSYIIYKLRYEKSSLNMQRINLLRDTLFNEFCQQKFITSELFIFQQGYRELLFDSQQLQIIESYLSKRSKHTSEVFSKLDSGTVSQNDFEHLLVIAQSWLNNNINSSMQDRCEKLFNYILNKENSRLSLVELEFVAKYTNYLVSKELNIPVSPVCFSDYDISTGKQFTDNMGGYSISSTGIIHINRKNAYSNKVLQMFDNMKIDYSTDLIHMIAHESRHSAQNYWARRSDKLDNFAFDYAVNHVIRKYYPNEYERNYSSQRIELDAEQYGWQFARILIQKHNASKIKDIEETTEYKYRKIADKALAFKKDENGKNHQLDFYDLVTLDEIIANHPEELRTFPILSVFYDSNGKRRDILHPINLDNYGNVDKSRFSDIQSRFFTVDVFHNNLLDRLDFNNLSLDEKRIIYHNVLDILDNNYREIVNSIVALEKKGSKVNTFSGLNKRRLKQSFIIWEFINKMKNDIILTDSSLKKQGKNSLILYRLEFMYDYYFKSLNRRMKRSPVEFPSDIVDSVEELSQFVDGIDNSNFHPSRKVG